MPCPFQVGCCVQAMSLDLLSGKALWLKSLASQCREGVHNRMLGINRKVSFDGAMPEYDLSKFTPLEVKAGTLIALHHSNVHFSKHNTSSKSRHAYSLHVVDGSDQHIWQPDNWCAPLSPACSVLLSYLHQVSNAMCHICLRGHASACCFPTPPASWSEVCHCCLHQEIACLNC